MLPALPAVAGHAGWVAAPLQVSMPVMTLHDHPIHRAEDTSASQIVTVSKMQQSTQTISVWSLYPLHGQGPLHPALRVAELPA